jgi:N-hydroxyarylamine O-acetyltransferase
MRRTLKHSEVQQYLALLGLPERDPDVDALTEIVRAHLTRVPFENISKLHRWKSSGFCGITDIGLFLEGIEQYHLGGTCYSNNYHLNQLLISLGFEVALCGADMNRPDVHIVNIVNVGGREYIVDVGYAAPFLKPLPRDLSTDYVVFLGTDRYVLRPKDVTGHSRLTLYRDGAAHHGYVVNPMSRSIGEFRDVIANSFRPDATFMNAVLLVRFSAEGSTVIHNMTYIESKGNTVKRTSLKTADELITAIEENFAIPRFISSVALDGLVMRQDAWS